MKLNKAKHEPEYGRKPNAVLYFVVCHLSRIFLKLKYNIKIENKDIDGIKPPFIALGNHPSKLDPFIMAATLYPHKINFLGTNYYFRNAILNSLFRAGGVIPKIQFFRDTRAVRSMNRVIERGGILGIFPEGRRSIDGSPSKISNAIAKFIKLYKVPVVAVVSKGNYLSLPRWSAFSHRGVIEISSTTILTAEQIEALTPEEIREVICSSLYYNDYEWNKVRQISFKHKKMAERLDFILHQCPSCGKENAMLSEDNRLYCKYCSNTAIMDEYGLLHPKDENCVIFEDSIKWFEWQRENILRRVMDADFSIASKVRELWVAKSLTGSYHKIGMGEIFFTREGLDFKGIVDGKHEEMFFPLKVLFSIVSEFGVNFEITDGKNTYRFDLEDGQDVIRYELAVEQLKKLRS